MTLPDSGSSADRAAAVVPWQRLMWLAQRAWCAEGQAGPVSDGLGAVRSSEWLTAVAAAGGDVFVTGSIW